MKQNKGPLLILTILTLFVFKYNVVIQESVLDACEVFITKLFPSLFPMMIITDCFLYFGLPDFLVKLLGKPFQKFLIATVLFTLFEYAVSFLLEAAFGLRWWDYSNDFLNIHGRVSLMYTIFWGLIGLILLEKLHPLVENFIQNIEVKIKKNEKLIIVYVLIALLILDFILSSLKYLKIF